MGAGRLHVGTGGRSGQQPQRNFAAIAWAAVSPGVGSHSCFWDFFDFPLKQWNLSVLVTHPQSRQPHHGPGLDLYPGLALPWEKRLILLPSRDVDEWKQS